MPRSTLNMHVHDIDPDSPAFQTMQELRFFTRRSPSARPSVFSAMSPEPASAPFEWGTTQYMQKLNPVLEAKGFGTVTAINVCMTGYKKEGVIYGLEMVFQSAEDGLHFGEAFKTGYIQPNDTSKCYIKDLEQQKSLLELVKAYEAPSVSCSL